MEGGEKMKQRENEEIDWFSAQIDVANIRQLATLIELYEDRHELNVLAHYRGK